MISRFSGAVRVRFSYRLHRLTQMISPFSSTLSNKFLLCSPFSSASLSYFLRLFDSNECIRCSLLHLSDSGLFENVLENIRRRNVSLSIESQLKKSRMKMCGYDLFQRILHAFGFPFMCRLCVVVRRTCIGRARVQTNIASTGTK